MTAIDRVKTVVKKLGKEYKVYEGYSGRGMFGQTCLGISGPDLNKIIATSKKRKFGETRYDTLGNHYIVYWPDLK